MKKLLNTLGLSAVAFLLTTVICIVIGVLWNIKNDGNLLYDICRYAFVASISTGSLWVLVFIYYLISTNGRELR